MPLACATDLTRRANTWVCTATVGTPLFSRAMANPTTVGQQVLQSPTPKIAASPSAAIRFRISGSSTQLSRGLMILVDRRQLFGEPSSQLFHEHLGIIEQAVHQIQDLAVEGFEARRQTLAGNLRCISSP